MIVKKTWERFVRSKRGLKTTYRDTYTGWFIFGIIPLYIDRRRIRH